MVWFCRKLWGTLIDSGEEDGMYRHRKTRSEELSALYRTPPFPKVATENSLYRRTSSIYTYRLGTGPSGQIIAIKYRYPKFYHHGVPLSDIENFMLITPNLVG